MRHSANRAKGPAASATGPVRAEQTPTWIRGRGRSLGPALRLVLLNFGWDP